MGNTALSSFEGDRIRSLAGGSRDPIQESTKGKLVTQGIILTDERC